MTAIGKSLFAKGTDMSSFFGMQLRTPGGDVSPHPLCRPVHPCNSCLASVLTDGCACLLALSRTGRCD